MPDLRATLARLGLSHSGAARLIGRDPRQGRRWVAKPNDHIANVFRLTEELSAATGEPPADILRRMYGGEG
ncbi:MAG: hypothetical protein KDB18_10135 [Salinibacterium sp.]|nr:hypothetical protein [Salinibacterium sp.]